jgi:flagellar biosynthetic protein FliP
MKRHILAIIGSVGAVLLAGQWALAQGLTLPTVNLGYKTVNDPQELVTNIKILMGLTVLTLAPAILIMMTSFTRIVIVLSFVRQAMGTQNLPPNQLVVGLSLFITLFIMTPFLQKINTDSVQPFLSGQIKQDEATDKALAPLREFMFHQTRDADLALFVGMSKMAQPKTRADVPTHVLIPSFIISELKTAFQIGFIIYLPFLVIDMVAASVLMAMGMMMLPPVIISLPFKIMLFVMVDGWALIVGSLVKSFG